MSILSNLERRHLITPPKWLINNTIYLTTMGSQAYGVSTKESDFDVYGVCIPPKRFIFPHQFGYIQGFGPKPQGFDQWQEHHIYDVDRDREYDFSVYNIVKYFDLVAGMNPNMIDSLFTARDCVLHSTQVGETIRDHRHHFLSKKLWPRFRGYAFSQLNKLTNKKSASGKRYERIQEHGYDLKNAYNIVRLLLEAEQLLTLGDLDLRRDREVLKSIRRGDWTEKQVRDFFTAKERNLDKAFANSKLPEHPDYDFLRDLLLQCLEMHYGSLEDAVRVPDKYERALVEVDKIVRGVL